MLVLHGKTYLLVMNNSLYSFLKSLAIVPLNEYLVVNLFHALITTVLRKLHWLPIQFRSEFKLATLVYMFIHTGFPKYFAPHLSTYRTTYNTRCSQSVANFLNVLKLQPTIHKFTKQFGFSFTFDAPLFGIHFLKRSVHHPLLPLLERSSKPIFTQRHILLSSFFLWLLHGADLFLSLDFEFACCYCLVAP